MEQLWTTELQRTVSQPLVAVGDVLLVATQPSGPTMPHGELTAVSLADGNTRWQKTFEYSSISGLVGHHWQGQDVVIVASSSSDRLHGRGHLLALNAAGEEVWRWQVNEEHFSAPTMVDNTAVVIVGGKTLALVDLQGDAQRFPIEVQASVAALLVLNDTVYIACRSADLVALALNGQKQWHFTYEGDEQDWLNKTPVIAEARVVATSSRGSVYVLDLATGQLVWHEDVGEGHDVSPPTTDGEFIYVGYKQGVKVLAAANGRPYWTFTTTRPVSAQPLVIGDHLLVTSEDHYLYVLNRSDGTEQWCHELTRRIEMPPLLTASAILVADRGGTVVALKRPSELRQAPAVVPVSDPAVMRQLRWETAERLEKDKQFLEAAELWHELGELERAAEQYEAGEEWLTAAKLWRQLDLYGRRAQALKRYARNLSSGTATDEEKAEAWEDAALAYGEVNEKGERDACNREVARYRHLPILEITIVPEEMIQNSWSKVDFTVKNDGFGTAQYMTVQLKDDRFEGQMAATQTMMTLLRGREFNGRLDVRPKHQGSSVPMQINIEYMDNGGLQILERIFYLPVSGEIQLVTGTLSTGRLGTTGSREALAELPAPEGVNLFELRNKLVEHFSREELLDVIFEMGLNQDDFGERLSTMARELITILARNDRIEDLITICERIRSHITWRDA